MVSVLGYQKLYKDKKQKQEGDVIVKENVKVITSDMDKKKKPINVNDDNLVFESNPKYKEGDVIVAGEISGAENGFIRKVVSVKKATGGYVVETQSALLTDVFEKAYIEKRLKLTKDGVQEVSNNVSKKDTDKAVETVQMMSAKMEKNYSVIEMADKKKDSSSSDGTETQDDSKSKEDSDKKTQKDSKSKEDDDKKTRNDSKLKEGSSEETQDDSKSKESDNEDPEKEEPESEYDFGKAFEETIDDVTISGDMGVDLEVELMLDINHGNIKYGMAMYRKAGANLSVDLKESMSKEHEKQLFEKKLPNLTGKLVVDLPLVSEELMEVEIFNKDLPAIWEKEWKSSWKPEDDLNYSDTGEQWNLYKTRYGEVNNVPATEFQFKIPFGWNVESEGVSDGLTGVDGVSEIEEKVVLSNERGVIVTFWSLTHELGGRSGVSMLQADITKADDSEFVPGFPDGTNTDFSTLGNFIVAKVHIIGELDMKRDSDFTPVDSGATFYAVVPESYLGTREFVGQAGNVDEFSFDYPTPYAFIAEAPDGTFTASEERDVVKILKSFKVAE